MNSDVIDLSSLDFWRQPATVRDQAFACLRRDRPVSLHGPITFGVAGVLPGDEQRGFWAVASHDLVRSASRAPETFVSCFGVSMEDFPIDFAREVGAFLVMDGPQHNRFRRLISSAFTPRNVARIEQQITRQARQLVDRLIDIADCDFVAEVSMRLPLWTISEMMGVPEGERDRLIDGANTMVAVNDPEFFIDAESAFSSVLTAYATLREIAMTLAAECRRTPRDDVMSALVGAEVDGHRLTDEEIAAFMVLLSIAGNDTTRHTASHAMKALCDFPDQRALLQDDLEARLPDAVEEMIRWATPVMQFRRTATHDTVLGDQPIEAGDKVVLLYSSANRDESVFPEPWRFDISRSPNDHLGFGGGGPHYCLGAHLARAQLRLLFGELLTRTPNLSVDEPEYLTSNFIHGIKRMPCRI